MAEAVQTETQQLTTNIKETIESILVAFILAFIFRAFVVEAFVIPTGSMAPTLLGAHMRFQCPDCGYVFNYNYSSPNDNEEDTYIPTEAMPADDVYCPNCGYHIAAGPLRELNGKPIPAVDAQGHLLAAPDGGQLFRYPGGARPQAVRYGDRILVLKYAYLLNQPKRWDVVVFKAPADPAKYKYTQNFIKRLVGEPGETLEILDGSVYVQDSVNQWQIQRRPYDVEQALWRIIYDNDFYPRGLPRTDRSEPWVQPWQAQSESGSNGWNLGQTAADGRTFRFSSQGAGTISFNASAVPAAQTTNDFLMYDAPADRRSPAGGEAPTWPEIHHSVPVSDLKLQFWYQPESSSSGSLSLLLSKRFDVFTAQITADAVSLLHQHHDGSITTDAGPVKLADIGLGGAAPMQVEFANVDYRVSLRLNGNEVLATTDDEYKPDVNELTHEFDIRTPPRGGGPRIQITASNQTCAISHISLWRSIYYTTLDPGLTWAMPNRPVHLHRRGEARPGGDGTYDDDEYFVMGDNSRVSGDARYWTDPIYLQHDDLSVDSGRVPGRFLLGKAFFVYWPAGFRPVTGWPAIIPDFGDMRFIH